MGFIAKILKLFLKIAKPFLKQAIIESIEELLRQYGGDAIPGGSDLPGGDVDFGFDFEEMTTINFYE